MKILSARRDTPAGLLTAFGFLQRRKRPIIIGLGVLLVTGVVATWVGYRHNIVPWQIGIKQTAVRISDRIHWELDRQVNEVKMLAQLPTLNLTIRDDNWKFLAESRERALKRQPRPIILPEDKQQVSAVIHSGGKTYKARIRLKGQLTDHLKSDKWSLRVKLKRGSTLFGMRYFSIMHPKTRDWHSDLVIYKHMRDNGIVAPRTFFVRVLINDVEKGIYVLQEHPSKELLAAHSKRDGPILKYDEKLYIADVQFGTMQGVLANFANAPIKVFQDKRWTKSDGRREQIAAAVGLLRGFAKKNVAADEVFDFGLWAKYYALIELWGTWHGPIWTNQIFYFNPITGKIEPIVSDPMYSIKSSGIDAALGHGEYEIAFNFLNNSTFRELFVAEAHKLHKEVVEDGLVQKLKQYEAQAFQAIRFEFRNQAPRMDLDYMNDRARFLSSFRPDNILVEKPRDTYGAVVNASLLRGVAGATIELENLLPFPVTVEGISLHSSGAVQNISFKKLTLPATKAFTVAKPVLVSLPKSLSIDDGASLKGTARIIGQERAYVFDVFPTFPISLESILPISDLASTTNAFPFLDWREEARRFVVASGDWEIDGPLILPKGVGLTLEAGVNLIFSRNAFLVGSGAFEFRGTSENPVILRGKIVAGEEQSWGGVVVRGATAPSIWENVEVHNTSGVYVKGLALTGGVTFYESDVTFRNCNFLSSQAEDSLNIVRSHFDFEGGSIVRTKSDALDIDFSNGTINGGLFEDIGGDGIDTSGSSVDIVDTILRRVKDKALSVGEDSRMTASKVTIEEVGTGVASKDLSQTALKDVSLIRIGHAALMAYQKKPEYGPGSILAERVTVEEAGFDALAQTGSTIVIDGIAVPSRPLDADALYASGYMKD